jgi:hypothetical protein
MELIESQYENLIKELITIIKDKWTLANRSGEIYLKQLFELFSEIYTNEEEEAEDTISKKINYKKITLVNECNSLFLKLNDLLKTSFKVYLDRIEKIKTNLIYIIDPNLSSKQIMIDKNDFKLFTINLAESFAKDYLLKHKLITYFVSKSRFCTSSQVSLMSCWIHEPYLTSEVYLFKLNKYLLE